MWTCVYETKEPSVGRDKSKVTVLGAEKDATSK